MNKIISTIGKPAFQDIGIACQKTMKTMFIWVVSEKLNFLSYLNKAAVD